MKKRSWASWRKRLSGVMFELSFEEYNIGKRGDGRRNHFIEKKVTHEPERDIPKEWRKLLW